MTAATSDDAAGVGDAAEHDGVDAGLLAHGEGQVAQLVGREAVDAGDDDAVDGRRGELGRPGRWPAWPAAP